MDPTIKIASFFQRSINAIKGIMAVRAKTATLHATSISYKMREKDTDPRYTWDIAKRTTDVDDLRYIYSKGKSDNVTWEAIINPLFPVDLIVDVIKKRKDSALLSRALRHRNCPPELVVEVLEKNINRDNETTQNAILSVYCPPAILARYLERGIDNETTRLAAINQNVLPSTIRKILAKGKNDVISMYLSKNASSPPDAVDQWLRAVDRKPRETFVWGHARKQKEAAELAEYEAIRKLHNRVKK